MNNEPMHIPNILTVLRIACIPCLVVAYYLPITFRHELAAGIFLFAALTDWCDGYLARKLNQTSRFGAFLDPVADKLVVASALLVLSASFASPWVAIPATIIVGREIVISALREWMAELGKRSKIAVSYLGKIKTALQMGAILVLLYAPAQLSHPLALSACIALWVAALLTLWTMLLYLKIAWGDLTSSANRA